MAKPTLLQSLLNRPSQSYSFPPERNYHVVKRDILRTVAPTSGSQLGTRPIDSKSPIPQEKEGAAGASSAAISSRADIPITTNAVTAPISIQQTELSREDDNSSGSSNSSANSSDKESDSDQDCFYTPNASPRVSLANSTIAISRPNSLRIPSDTSLKPDHSHSIPSSSTSSLSSTNASGDANSLFSEPLTESTLPTSVMSSDAPPKRSRVNTAPAAAAGKPRPAKRRQSGSYTAEDWEQEAQAQARRPPAPPAVAAPLPRKPGQIAKTMSRANPSLMMNMAVLMEEDEETQAVMTPPLSRVLVTAAAARTRTASAPRSGSSSSGSSRSANVRRRRSRSLGYSDSRSPLARVVASESVTTTHEPVDVHAEPYAPQLPSSGTPGYTSLTLPRAPMSAGMVLGSAHAKGKNRLSVFSAIDIISGADGHVDLTRSGTAQTTMATAEVVRGLGGAASRNPLKRIFSSRRREAREGRQTALGFTSHRPPPTLAPSLNSSSSTDIASAVFLSPECRNTPSMIPRK
ncbi:hypothetical protein GGF50DRAFT_128205 [Schizophyllum commune]